MAREIPELVQRLTYPFKGMDLASPLARMPRGSAVLIKNVIPTAGRTSQTDQNMLRRIGGKRPGLARNIVDFTTAPAASQILMGAYLWNCGGSTTKRLIAVTSGSDGKIYDGVYGSSVTLVALGSYTRQHYLPTFAALGGDLFITSDQGNGKSRLTSVSGALPSGADWAPGGVFSPETTICCRYINRIFAASRLRSNFQASKFGDGNNFDAAGVTPEFAYDGNATGQAGQPGDRITSLFSLTDDYLGFGCDSSIWVMYGDPRYGGRVRMASDVTGIAGPNAQCYDEDGNVWFVGGQGLYKWRPGGVPKEILKGRMGPYLEDVLRPQATANRSHWQIAFDRKRRTLYLWNFGQQLQDGTFPTWVIGYAIDYDAPFLLEFQAGGGGSQVNRPYMISCFDDGNVLVGGLRGICDLDAVANRASDLPFLKTDSTPVAIDCLVKFPPFLPDGGRGEWCLNELQATGAKGCGALTYYLMAGRSADEVVEKTYTSDYAATGTLFASDDGFQAPVGTRITDAVLQLIIAQNSLTADMRLDSFDLVCEPMGRRRYGA